MAGAQVPSNRQPIAAEPRLFYGSRPRPREPPRGGKEVCGARGPIRAPASRSALSHRLRDGRRAAAVRRGRAVVRGASWRVLCPRCPLRLVSLGSKERWRRHRGWRCVRHGHGGCAGAKGGGLCPEQGLPRLPHEVTSPPGPTLRPFEGSGVRSRRRRDEGRRGCRRRGLDSGVAGRGLLTAERGPGVAGRWPGRGAGAPAVGAEDGGGTPAPGRRCGEPPGRFVGAPRPPPLHLRGKCAPAVRRSCPWRGLEFRGARQVSCRCQTWAWSPDGAASPSGFFGLRFKAWHRTKSKMYCLILPKLVSL